MDCANLTTSCGERPKQSIESPQNRSFAFSLECRELQSQSRIFDHDGLLTAQEETDESKDREEKAWHAPDCLSPFHAKSSCYEQTE